MEILEIFMHILLDNHIHIDYYMYIHVTLPPFFRPNRSTPYLLGLSFYSNHIDMIAKYW